MKLSTAYVYIFHFMIMTLFKSNDFDRIMILVEVKFIIGSLMIL